MNEQLLEHWQKALSVKRLTNVEALTDQGMYFGNSTNCVFTDFKTGDSNENMANALAKYMDHDNKQEVDLDVEQVYYCLKGYKAMNKLGSIVSFSDGIYLIKNASKRIAKFDYDINIKTVNFYVNNLYKSFDHFHRLGVKSVDMYYNKCEPVLFKVDSHLVNIVCPVRTF